MKLTTLVVCAALTTASAAFGQIGLTLKQCTAKYGAAIGRESQEWHKFKSERYYLEIHFYKDKADAVSYLNLIGSARPLTGNQIQELLSNVRTLSGRSSMMEPSQRCTS